MQAPRQGHNVRGLQAILSVKGIFDTILECLSWRDLAHSLVPNKGTLGQVVAYLSEHSELADGHHSPNFAYNYYVWEKVYPLFHLAQIVGLRTFPGLSTACHLFYVHDGTHDELLARSLQPFRHCQEVSLQTPTTLSDLAFTALFKELSNWPQLRSICFDFGAISRKILYLIQELPQRSQLVVIDLSSFWMTPDERGWFQSTLNALQHLDYEAGASEKWRRRRKSNHQKNDKWAGFPGRRMD